VSCSVLFLPRADAAQPGDFFASLSNLSALPATLQFLAFHWVFDYQYEEEDVDLTYNEGPSVLRGVRQGLVRRCAALRAVWLEGSYFMYSWQHGHGTEKDKESREGLMEREQFANQSEWLQARNRAGASE
jgi:hypothetical protein